jgi:hypothetical protein
MTCFVELTVADHVQDGFVPLARWEVSSFADGERLLQIASRMTGDSPENPKTDDYNLILDLHDCEVESFPNLVDETFISLQVAMRLAPEAVKSWLSTRPKPDTAPDCGLSRGCPFQRLGGEA